MKILMGLLLITSIQPAFADIQALQQRWAEVSFELAEDERQKGLEDLAETVRQAVDSNPDDAQLLVWKGIIVSSLAGEKGGFSALSLVKEAKNALETAQKIDDTVLNGSVYTSLGTLYHKVPGWPVSFGSDKKAKQFLQQALQKNPHGIEPNFFMAEIYYDDDEYQRARDYLLLAQQAPSLLNRPITDKARRGEVTAMLKKVEFELNKDNH